MKKLLLLAGCAALAACSQNQEAATNADDANVAVAEADANVAAPAEFTLAETTWDYTQDGKPHTTSIDAAGNYETNSGTEHVDHGKLEMVDGKACFSSAMNQDGPECWTVQQTEVGQSMDSTSDKGNKLTVTRRDYVAFTPKA
jgi:hypothetical protein